jgi:hypothetical protein
MTKKFYEIYPRKSNWRKRKSKRKEEAPLASTIKISILKALS